MSTPIEKRLLEMQELVESLRTETQELRQQVEAHAGALRTEGRETEAEATRPQLGSDVAMIADISEATTSRRKMFKAGAAVAAAAVTLPMLSKQAAAADGDNFVIGANNLSNTGGHTRLNSTGNGLLSGQNILTVTDNADSSSFPAAIGTYAQGDRVTNAFYAFTNARLDSDTNTGHGMVIASRATARSHILLESGSVAPATDTYAHQQGSIRQADGDFWFCVDGGTPGTWRKVAGPGTAGAVHAIAPQRVYDSRFGDGPVPVGTSRVISVADGIDVSSGASTSEVVPAGATSVFFNLAVVNTVDSGFLSAAPGDAAALSAASINWSETGQILNNGTMSTLDDSRQLRIFSGGLADIIIDVTGYTL